MAHTRLDPIDRITIRSKGASVSVRCITMLNRRDVHKIKPAELLDFVEQAYSSSARTLRPDIRSALEAIASGQRGSLELTYDAATEVNLVLET